MTNKVVKSVIIFIIMILILLTIKPCCFYYDVDKTKLKRWDLYRETKNIEDIMTLHNVIILCAIISSILI